MEDLKTILVVDDDQSMRDLIRLILEKAGYRVRIAADGVEAMQLLGQRKQIDVVVADIVMPRLNGVEMLMKLHETWPSLPAVVISGKVDLQAPSIQNLAPFLSSEKACLLKKPFTSEQLIDAVKRAVDRAASA